MPDWKAAANLVRKIAENYKLPYYTMSPTYSVCKDHGYLAGEQYTCPVCGAKTEVYSRITGYYRPVQNWNDGKSQEFKDRRVYDIGRSHLSHTGPLHIEDDHPVSAAPAKAEADDALRLFATRTCPNCRQAEKLLDEASIPYTKLLAEENVDLASSLGIRQAPTLVIGPDDKAVKIVGLGAVRRYIAERGA